MSDVQNDECRPDAEKLKDLKGDILRPEIDHSQTPPGQNADRRSLIEGRRLFEQHLSQPAAAGGISLRGQRRYQIILNKFVSFAHSCGVEYCDEVDDDLRVRYVRYLQARDYVTRAQLVELHVLAHWIKWLTGSEHLANTT